MLEQPSDQKDTGKPQRNSFIVSKSCSSGFDDYDKIKKANEISKRNPNLIKVMESSKEKPSPTLTAIPDGPTNIDSEITLPPIRSPEFTPERSAQNQLASLTLASGPASLIPSSRSSKLPTSTLQKPLSNLPATHEPSQTETQPHAATTYSNYFYYFIPIALSTVATLFLNSYFGIKSKLTSFFKTTTFSSDELTIRKEYIPQWFEAFYKNTNEKEQIITAINDIFSLVSTYRSNSFPYKDLVVLDMGCCGSLLHVMIAKQLIANSLVGENIFLIGLDINSTAIELTRKELTKSHLKKHFTSKLEIINFFKEDSHPEYLIEVMYNLTHQQKADIIIASHVFYYSPNVEFSVNATLAALSPTGVAIYIHESALSFGKLLPIGCKTPVNSHTNNQIKQALAKHSDINIYIKTLTTKIFPPMPFKEFISKWLENNTTAKETPEWQTTKNLIEFMFQMPLEVLEKKPEVKLCLEYGFKHLSSKDYMIIHSQIILAIKGYTINDSEQNLYDIHDVKADSVMKDELVEDFILTHANT